jgi:hypothetical protein
MNIGYLPGLKPLAMALIFAPEPLTTIAGIGLLGYTAYAGRKKEAKPRRRKNASGSFYTYRIDKVNDSTITYQIFTTRQGQLPLIWPAMTKLYYKAQACHS